MPIPKEAVSPGVGMSVEYATSLLGRAVRHQSPRAHGAARAICPPEEPS